MFADINLISFDKAKTFMPPHSTWPLASVHSHCFVSTYVCVLVHLTAAVIYPAVKHLLCKALIKASAERIDKPFFTTTA